MCREKEKFERLEVKAVAFERLEAAELERREAAEGKRTQVDG